MSKRAQNINQIFIYMLTIIVVGAILLFGYKAINGFSDDIRETALLEFKKSLESSIKSITPEYNTLRNKRFEMSSDYKQVCFVRNYWEEGQFPLYSPSDFKGYPKIQDEVETNTKASVYTGRNIFLIKRDKEVAEKNYKIGMLRFKNDNSEFECFNVTHSALSIKIEGKGDHVIIS